MTECLHDTFMQLLALQLRSLWTGEYRRLNSNLGVFFSNPSMLWTMKIWCHTSKCWLDRRNPGWFTNLKLTLYMTLYMTKVTAFSYLQITIGNTLDLVSSQEGRGGVRDTLDQTYVEYIPSTRAFRSEQPAWLFNIFSLLSTFFSEPSSSWLYFLFVLLQCSWLFENSARWILLESAAAVPGQQGEYIRLNCFL